MTQKIYSNNKNFLSSSKFYLIKSKFKEAIKCFFIFVILINIVIYHKLNFILKLDPKMGNF